MADQVNGYAPTQTVTDLTEKDKNQLIKAGPISNEFDSDERLFTNFENKNVSEPPNTTARQIQAMLGRDGTAKKLEQIITVTIRSADYEIQGDGPEADFIRECMEDKLDTLIDQCTGGAIYGKAFFELVYTNDESGRLVYDKIAWRPPASCQASYDPKTSEHQGFRQRVAHPGLVFLPAERAGMPGYVDIPEIKAFIYRHGMYREPLKGVSDMDVAVEAYELKEKLKFLWFQFLENQSLPKLVVYGNDITDANKMATALAQLKSSGVLGLKRPPEPTARAFDVLESSGAGATQFIEAIRYLEQQQTNSILAGFTDLTQAATGGKGSNALSADQSEFFLGSQQATADEISEAITCKIFKSLVVWNFGATAQVPKLQIGPIGNAQTDRALNLLSSLLVSPNMIAPEGFVDELLTYTAAFLGLDPEKVQSAIEVQKTKDAAIEQQKQDLQQQQFKMQQESHAAALAVGAVGKPTPGGLPNPGSGKSTALSAMHAPITTATNLVAGALSGIDPEDMIKSYELNRRPARSIRKRP